MTINLTGNEAVSYSANAGGLVLGENVVPLTFGNNAPAGDFYNNYWYPYYPQWYPTYSTVVYNPSKIEQAFKIVGKLIETKVISKNLTVKEFMKTVSDVAEVI